MVFHRCHGPHKNAWRCRWDYLGGYVCGSAILTLYGASADCDAGSHGSGLFRTGLSSLRIPCEDQTKIKFAPFHAWNRPTDSNGTSQRISPHLAKINSDCACCMNALICHVFSDCTFVGMKCSDVGIVGGDCLLHRCTWRWCAMRSNKLGHYRRPDTLTYVVAISPTRIGPVIRIISHIGVEVEVVFLSDGIDLQEAAQC